MKASIFFLIIAGLAIGALAAPKKGKKGKKGSYSSSGSSSSESDSVFESGSFAYEDTTPYVRPYGLGFGKE